MTLEPILQRIKNEIKKDFSHIHPIDRPGLAVIINTEDESSINFANIIKTDCEEVNFNWFSININSSTEKSYITDAITEYEEMEDVTIVLVLCPLPNKLKISELGLIKYDKLNSICSSNRSTFGTRLGILNIIKDTYNANKK